MDKLHTIIGCLIVGLMCVTAFQQAYCASSLDACQELSNTRHNELTECQKESLANLRENIQKEQICRNEVAKQNKTIEFVKVCEDWSYRLATKEDVERMNVQYMWPEEPARIELNRFGRLTFDFAYSICEAGDIGYLFDYMLDWEGPPEKLESNQVALVPEKFGFCELGNPYGRDLDIVLYVRDECVRWGVEEKWV